MDKEFVEYLSKVIDGHIINVSTLSGGDINNAACLHTKDSRFFIKWNDAPNALKMFESEANGLISISNTKTIFTPKIISCSVYQDKAYLILDFIEAKEDVDNEDLFKFGTQLADLHNCGEDYFGFEEDNFIGTLPQKNSIKKSWSEFYIDNRLRPQLDLAKKQSYLSQISFQSIDSFYNETKDLLAGIRPSLLHGDLWSGNYIISKNGTPYLIDTAAYYGHREVDLAMSELFGDFGESFYQGYNSVFKIDPEYSSRKDLYQLYYLLVHLNLFGRSYEGACLRIIRKFS